MPETAWQASDGMNSVMRPARPWRRRRRSCTSRGPMPRTRPIVGWAAWPWIRSGISRQGRAALVISAFLKGYGQAGPAEHLAPPTTQAHWDPDGRGCFSLARRAAECARAAFHRADPLFVAEASRPADSVKYRLSQDVRPGHGPSEDPEARQPRNLPER